MRESRLRLWLGVSFLLGSFTLFLLELGLRAAARWFPEPARSFVDESARRARSGARRYGTRLASRPTIALPPPGDRDLLVVGDSFAFGHFVDADATFGALLGRRLGLSVANLGVESAQFEQYNRMLEWACATGRGTYSMPSS